MPKITAHYFLPVLLLALSLTVNAAGDKNTKFSNKDSISNTRHNMTQSTMINPVGGSGIMDPYRNNYGEVCVYCHTPHGTNTTTTAPLWNRTMLTSTTYTTYSSMSIEGVVGNPGANSLTCLSCHDGKVAVDSIINMPGSGRYSKAQENAQNDAFLDTWDSSTTGSHMTMDPGGTNGTGCLACHAPGMPLGGTATDFTAFALGTDLSNDHPIGVLYRGLTAGTDYEGGTTPTADGKLLYFDTDADARPDKNEVRFYDTGDGYEVECASCHDPHGVPSGGAGSVFNATFLRIANTGSALCLTCHAK